MTPAAHVGSATCANCHAQAAERWRGSAHDHAMEVPGPESVRGNFADQEFAHFGVTTRFSRAGDRYRVRTEGADGQLQDFEVAYTFGWEPLQQYLIAQPGGRLQALTLAWDTRARRWFSLYPDERIPAGDPLHWTGPLQNWNFMCAECHSTDLKKNWVENEQRYATTWRELDVACEACHGPGSRHVAWAEGGKRGRDHGLLVDLRERDDDVWRPDPQRGTVRRATPPKAFRAEVETCARCHSRRSQIASDYVPGKPLLDSHEPVLLDAGLYHADGQIQDEVYEYGSFLQSRMHAAGVTCSDCHDPHSAKLRAEGDALCARCHDPGVFATSRHHFHAKPVSCADCHMPRKTYMQVDPRRDHSLRVPRPDLAEKLGTPSACQQCHQDKPHAWAIAALDKAYGKRERPRHFGEVLHAGRERTAEAAQQLANLIVDPSAPGIARATAVGLLEPWLSARTLPAFAHACQDADPLVRLAAARLLEALPEDLRTQLGTPLLGDAVRAVRTHAGRALAGLPAAAPAVAEYRAAQQVESDRPGAWLNLGVLADRLGDPVAAERSFRRAIELVPGFAPAYVNLADHLRTRARDPEGEQVLRRGLEHAPRDGGLWHGLGLNLARQKRYADAVAPLRKAAELEPERARYAYVLGVALDSLGRLPEARDVLERALTRHPGDPELRAALAEVRRKQR